MAILNTAGKVLWHYFLILFLAILYVSTKDMNFSHVFDSPPLTTLQQQIVQITLYILIVSGIVLAILARLLGERGGAVSAFFFTLFAIGLFLILIQVHGETLLNPKWTREGAKQIFFVSGSLLGILGILGYTALRFPHPPMDEALLKLVEESRSVEPEEDSYCPICGPNIRVPLTWRFCPNCGVEFAPGVDSSGARNLKGERKSPEKDLQKKGEEEEEKKGAEIVECPQCGGKMKITVDKRPIKVKCPHCGSEVIVK